MTRDEILKTDWAKRFVEGDPSCFNDALKIITDDEFEGVYIFESDETGEDVLAIEANNAPGFWLDALPTYVEAVQVCEEMGWRIL